MLKINRKLCGGVYARAWSVFSSAATRGAARGGRFYLPSECSYTTSARVVLWASSPFIFSTRSYFVKNNFSTSLWAIIIPHATLFTAKIILFLKIIRLNLGNKYFIWFYCKIVVALSNCCKVFVDLLKL